MRSGIWISCAAVVALLWGVQPCSAAFGNPDSALFSLGTPTLSGHVVNFDVYVKFTIGTPPPPAVPDTGYVAAAFQIDATKSSPLATLAPVNPVTHMNDFSAFSFSLDTNVLVGWESGIFANAPGVFAVDDNFGTGIDLSASPVPYHLGVLSYDLSRFHVTSSHSLKIDITATNSHTAPYNQNTLLQDQNPNDFTTESTVISTFASGSQAFPDAGGNAGPLVPEPSSVVLAILGSALLLVGLMRGRLSASRQGGVA